MTGRKILCQVVKKRPVNVRRSGPFASSKGIGIIPIRRSIRPQQHLLRRGKEHTEGRRFPEEKEENDHRIERAYGLFSRALTLPADVDPKKVEASFKDGILKVVLHKNREAAGKRIEIKTG